MLDAAAGETLGAFTEEQAEAFTRPPLTLEVTERCARCIMIDVDPDTAEMDGRCFCRHEAAQSAALPG